MTVHSAKTIHTLGHSVENRPIELHLFNAKLDTPLHTLYIGVFHGDEGISGELLQAFSHHLETAQPTAQPVGIIPVLNPDGHTQDQRTNANGVDLNRNFPTENWQPDCEDPIYFPGKSPGSEPETQVIIEIMKQTTPGQIISVHSPYKVINFDGPAEGLAHTMAKQNGYEVVAHIGYPTPGSFGTYAGIERQIPVITLELPEDEPFEQVWRDNVEALFSALDPKEQVQ